MTISPPFSFASHRPLIMGIINVTPDSFSGDGLMGQSDTRQAALKQAAEMLADGADILDIGGESSRPGSAPVSADEETSRTVPVIEAIHKQYPSMPVSIDTVKPAVAAAALKAGACMLNDISGVRQDPAMLTLAASTGAYLVLMHNSTKPGGVKHDPHLGQMYDAANSSGIVQDVSDQLEVLAQHAVEAGVARERIILDPGLGFGKTVKQHLQLINELDKLKALGYPLLVGPSRKAFIGHTLNLPVEERLEGTAACIAICVLHGASLLRVHDVKAMSRVVRMAAAIGESSR